MEDLFVFILRLIHVFGAVFWAGGAFFLLSFVQPTVIKTGEAGQKFMQHLGLKTSLSPAMGGASTLTMLSGLILYYRIFNNNFGGAMESGYGILLSLGALFGILAWVAGLYFQGRSTARMKVLSAEMASAGGPPTPDQIAEMQALGKQLTLGGRLGGILLTLALIGMAGAEAF